MAMTQEQLAKAIAARRGNPSIGRRKIMAITGCTGFAAAKFLKSGHVAAEEKTGSVRENVKPSSSKAANVKTLADFRQAYDKDTIIPAKIRDGLGFLGPEGWEYEVEFAKMCGVSLYDMGRVRDRFADNIVTIGRNSKRAWAGSKALAAKMREMV